MTNTTHPNNYNKSEGGVVGKDRAAHFCSCHCGNIASLPLLLLNLLILFVYVSVYVCALVFSPNEVSTIRQEYKGGKGAGSVKGKKKDSSTLIQITVHSADLGV